MVDHASTADAPALFTPITLRGLTLRNRIVVSPMCEYSSDNGFANDWHVVHLGSRAVGGAGLVLTEATAVTPDGRISPEDLGIWSDEHIAPLARIVDFIHSQGAAAGMQLAHAGRKASTFAPGKGNGEVPQDQGGWETFGPSETAYNDSYPEPSALTVAQIDDIVEAFVSAAERARAAGFDTVEIHGAHGYLLHEYLSPLSNHRSDAYGGSLENRLRFPLRVIRAVREAWPADLPVLLRISATDWVDGGWDLEQSTELARQAKELGIDLVDTSTGGLDPRQQITTGPGYQVPFAAKIREDAGIAVGAVGEITEATQANELIENGDADVVLLARELLRDPYWPLHAAVELGAVAPIPLQYQRAFPTAVLANA